MDQSLIRHHVLPSSYSDRHSRAHCVGEGDQAMKRAVVAMLVLSLCAFPLFARGEQLTSAKCVSLEHIQGGWRMEIKCDQGAGAISLMDAGGYRGEGVFSKWSQE